ncbi:MAG TPA: flavodoxin domain-containing protein [Bryobacteraceae bacterium]|nr:flavodoxin domain-containing protein [Bryobacteraceae bacterium]
MKPVLVLYATRQGHTRHVAEYVAKAVQARGVPADVVDSAHIPSGFALGAHSAAILVASVHLGRHEPEMTRFVKLHLAELESIPAAFLSVSLSEAGAEDVSAPSERREQAASDVKRMIDTFLSETGWHPARIKAVAGALLYTKYNFLLRLVMKRIARQAGGAIDTSNDREYTDWTALDQFVDELVRTKVAQTCAEV